VSLAIVDLYSKRQKKLRGEVPDVYTYDEIPTPLRVQVLHIWHNTLGDIDAQRNTEDREHITSAYGFIVKTLRHEHGVILLPPGRKINFKPPTSQKELTDFLMEETDSERVLDAIELSFRIINTTTRKFDYLSKRNSSELADKAIDELNYRFKEHGLGFQFVNSMIIRIDSELAHEEIVKPALALLHNKSFSGAQEEFLQAYEHYRHGNNKEALNECLKAFESTMKVICNKRQWAYDPQKATSKDLIKVCLEKELIPTFWQQQFTALRSLLESGIPTGRNRLSGHGQGSTPTDVPDYLVAYILHMTASAIVFLVEAERHLP
jgi:hypothetical protein